MGVTLQGDEQMTKEFFVQEIDAHSEMMYHPAESGVLQGRIAGGGASRMGKARHPAGRAVFPHMDHADTD